MGDTNDIKKGAVIRHNNDLYVVTVCQFVNPGKGAAFTKTKMKSIASGKSIEITYKSGESVDTVQVNYQNMQFLYKNNNLFSFMKKDDYETVDIDEGIIGEDAKYLKEGLEIIGVFHEDAVVAIRIPQKITYIVAEAASAVKGDTAGGNVTKEVVLENGHKVQVPIFIKQGEEIIVNTETNEYGGRVQL
jgi:elongation factor P